MPLLMGNSLPREAALGGEAVVLSPILFIKWKYLPFPISLKSSDLTSLEFKIYSSIWTLNSNHSTEFLNHTIGGCLALLT